MLHRPTHPATRLAGVVLFLLIPVTVMAGTFSEQQRLVDEATVTFERFLETPGIASWYRPKPRTSKASSSFPSFSVEHFSWEQPVEAECADALRATVERLVLRTP